VLPHVPMEPTSKPPRTAAFAARKRRMHRLQLLRQPPRRIC
jgi:hypothetical protein